MAVFTEVSDADVARFLKAYGLPKPDAVTGIAEGVENTNYKVLAAGKRYILTLYEARVAVEDIPYFLAVMEHIAASGIPAAHPIRALDGERLSALAGRPAALIEFLPGRPVMEPSRDDAFQAGKILAELHRAAADFSATRPNSMGHPCWREMATKAGEELNRFGPGLAIEIDKTLSLLRQHWPTDLPRGTIHADLFPDNLLLDHGQPSGVIDFYFACTDFLAYDLSISMNAYTPEEGDVDLFNAEGLLDGYQSVRQLRKAELDALDILLCGNALRFFLSRAVDLIFAPKTTVYTPKDPLPWLRLMRHHRRKLEVML